MVLDRYDIWMLKAFPEDKHADSNFLYIQNSIQWIFTKALCQEAQVGTSTYDNFTQKILRIRNARANRKISEDVYDIIRINMQEKTKGYNNTENVKLTATLIGQCCSSHFIKPFLLLIWLFQSKCRLFFFTILLT